MKKIYSFMFGILVVFSLPLTAVFASEDVSKDDTVSIDEQNIEEIDQILIDFGYDEDDVIYYSEDIKQDLAETIVNNPSKLDVSTTYLVVDNIAILEYYTNTSEEDLISNGFKKDEVESIKGQIKDIQEYSNEELQNDYELSAGEANLIKKAVEVNPNYIEPKDFGDKNISASAEIAASKLSYTQSVTNRSTSSQPRYGVVLKHNWKSPYFIQGFRDNVAAAWGGGLDVRNISGTLNYYESNWYTQKFGKLTSIIASSVNVTPDTGIVFSFPQSRVNSGQAKVGQFSFEVFQNRKRNLSTSLVSRYAHKILSVSDVTISATPSISIGSGKDVSPQRRTNITY